ncbi:hypothetical protein ScPMuIL_000578 [Solemya velum]
MDFSRLFSPKNSMEASRGKAKNCAGGNFSLEWEPEPIDPREFVRIFLNMIAPASFQSGVVHANLSIPNVQEPIFNYASVIDCSTLTPYTKECPIKKGAHIKHEFKTSELSRMPSGTFIGRMEIHNEDGELVICFELTVTFLGEKKLFQRRRGSMLENETDDRLKNLASSLPTFILQSKASNTYKQYNSSFVAWCRWCEEHQLTPIPASDYYFALYIIYLTQSNCSISKIEHVVYSVRWAHDIANEIHPCDSFLVRSVLQGAKRLLAKPVNKKEPISAEILARLVDQFGRSNSLYDKRIVTVFNWIRWIS